MSQTKCVKGLPSFTLSQIENYKCETCEISKAQKQTFKKQRDHSPLLRNDKLHSDVCGPYKTMTRRGHRYFMSLIDDSTRLPHV